MKFKNSQQDIFIDLNDTVKKVSLKISGGADSAIVGYMLCKYVTIERPDIKIIPITSIHPTKPYQEIYAKRVLEFLRNEFGDIFTKHYVNTAKNADDYVDAQDRVWQEADSIESIDCNFSGITSNPPIDIMEKHHEAGPDDDRNGKKFPVTHRASYRHLVNIDKKGVAELYESLGVLDTLFPITRSCEAHDYQPHYDIDKHCEKCWWCMEREWGFGRYE